MVFDGNSHLSLDSGTGFGGVFDFCADISKQSNVWPSLWIEVKVMMVFFVTIYSLMICAMIFWSERFWSAYPIDCIDKWTIGSTILNGWIKIKTVIFQLADIAWRSMPNGYINDHQIWRWKAGFMISSLASTCYKKMALWAKYHINCSNIK